MREAALEALDRLVGYPTISADSNRALIDDLASRLEGAGARVEVMADSSGAKANLWATLGPEGDGGLVLSGHTDVVPVEGQPWTRDPFKMVEAEGRLYGRGTCDMKGFIACCLAALPLFRTSARPVHFAFTYDEEIGCLGAQALVAVLRETGVRPAMAIIGEPTEMRVIEGHKGCCEYTTTFSGLEGHGSTPDLGVNAVEYAARYVGRLLELRDGLTRRAPEGSRFEPPWSTINVGAMTGGAAHNVIPAEATVAWEMRPVVEADADWVKSQLQDFVERDLLPAMQARHPDAAIHTVTEGEVAGLEPMQANAARDLVARLTGANTSDVVSFGTEAGLFQGLGIDTVVCGPGSIRQAHMADEFIEIQQIDACLGLLSRLAERLSSGD
ncbi:MAG: acetylornithine deacetylase [Pseudomonadota bacterium]